MNKKNSNIVILVGAGSAKRFNQGIPKQYATSLDGISPFERTLDTFLKHQMVDFILPVINHEHKEYYNQVFQKVSDRFVGIETKLLPICFGGDNRKDSVLNGLKEIASYNPNKVLIHDVARPFVSSKIITAVLCGIANNMGVVPAIKINDTVKRVKDSIIYEELDRENLYSIQTPQGFLYHEILKSYEKYSYLNLTDDSSYFIKNRGQVKIIEGDILNSKITFQEDVKLILSLAHARNNKYDRKNVLSNLKFNSNANTIKSKFDLNKIDIIDKDENEFNFSTANSNENSNKIDDIFRVFTRKKGIMVGQGIDIHEFSHSASDNRSLFLCGIKIPYHKGLKGHSDADVAIHAVVDSILGALGKGDIGDFFPPSDERWKGVNSTVFLEFARDLLIAENIMVNNLDITLLLEEPKISQHKKDMRENMAKILGIEINKVNIKATTTEKLGFVGRKEGVVASAIICLESI